MIFTLRFRLYTLVLVSVLGFFGLFNSVYAAPAISPSTVRIQASVESTGKIERSFRLIRNNPKESEVYRVTVNDPEGIITTHSEQVVLPKGETIVTFPFDVRRNDLGPGTYTADIAFTPIVSPDGSGGGNVVIQGIGGAIILDVLTKEQDKLRAVEDIDLSELINITHAGLGADVYRLGDEVEVSWTIENVSELPIENIEVIGTLFKDRKKIDTFEKNVLNIVPGKAQTDTYTFNIDDDARYEIRLTVRKDNVRLDPISIVVPLKVGLSLPIIVLGVIALTFILLGVVYVIRPSLLLQYKNYLIIIAAILFIIGLFKIYISIPIISEVEQVELNTGLSFPGHLVAFNNDDHRDPLILNIFNQDEVIIEGQWNINATSSERAFIFSPDGNESLNSVSEGYMLTRDSIVRVPIQGVRGRVRHISLNSRNTYYLLETVAEGNYMYYLTEDLQLPSALNLAGLFPDNEKIEWAGWDTATDRILLMITRDEIGERYYYRYDPWENYAESTENFIPSNELREELRPLFSKERNVWRLGPIVQISSPNGKNQLYRVPAGADIYELQKNIYVLKKDNTYYLLNGSTGVMAPYFEVDSSYNEVYYLDRAGMITLPTILER